MLKPSFLSRLALNNYYCKAFLYDFEGGHSADAQGVLNARKSGVSPIAKYTGFLVCQLSVLIHDLMLPKTLMLLRRFTFLNALPITAIQSQGSAKRTIHVCVKEGF